jgi:hypothetical protein
VKYTKNNLKRVTSLHKPIAEGGGTAESVLKIVMIEANAATAVQNARITSAGVAGTIHISLIMICKEDEYGHENR